MSLNFEFHTEVLYKRENICLTLMAGCWMVWAPARARIRKSFTEKISAAAEQGCEKILLIHAGRGLALANVARSAAERCQSHHF